MKKGIIFDLDGTLWNSTDNVGKGWTKALENVRPDMGVITGEMVIGHCGYTTKEIGHRLFPNDSEEYQEKMMAILSKGEVDYLKDHGGILFEGLHEALTELKKEYHLYVVSNCSDGYIDAFLDYHNTRQYFDDYEMYGRTLRPKCENIELVVKRNNLDKAVYVGDTRGDESSARKAGVPFIHAAYGYGDAVNPDLSVGSMMELVERIKEIL